MAQDNPFAEFLTPKEDDNPFAEFLPAKKPKTLGDSYSPVGKAVTQSLVDANQIPNQVNVSLGNTAPVPRTMNYADVTGGNMLTDIRNKFASSLLGSVAAPAIDILQPDVQAGDGLIEQNLNALKKMGIGLEGARQSVGDWLDKTFDTAPQTVDGRARYDAIAAKERTDLAGWKQSASARDIAENQRRVASGLPTMEMENSGLGVNQFADTLRNLSGEIDAKYVTTRQQNIDRSLGSALDQGLVPLAKFIASNPIDSAVSVLPSSAAFMAPAAGVGRISKLAGVSDAGVSLAGRASVGAAATLSTADQSAQSILKAPEQELMQLAPYQAFLAQGANPSQARTMMAEQAYNATLPASAAVNTLAAGFSPGNVMEDLASAGKLKALAATRLGSTAKAVLGEFGGEFGQGAGDQLSQNLGSVATGQLSADELGKNVAASGFIEGAAGGLPGAATGFLATPNRTQVVPPNQTTEQPVTAPVTEPVAQGNRASVVPPNAPIVDPAGMDAAISGAPAQPVMAPVTTLGTSPPVMDATAGISQPQATAPAQVEPTDDIEAMLIEQGINPAALSDPAVLSQLGISPETLGTVPVSTTLGATNDTGRYENTESNRAGYPTATPAGPVVGNGPAANPTTNDNLAANIGRAAPQESGTNQVSDPYSADSFFTALDQEIGWSEIGGRIQRSPDQGNAVGGDVIGRSSWVGKMASDGTESNFWRNRPDGSLNEKQARAAIQKHKAGERLGQREQAFIDYATRTASEYSNEARTENEISQETSRLTALNDRMGEAMADVAEVDQSEAVIFNDLIQRAYDAGAQPEQILDITFDGPEAVQARQLIDLAKQLEANRGNDTGTTQETSTSGSGNTQERATTVSEEVGLFAQATNQETVEAERRKRDADRDGKTGSGRTDMLSGEGELFAGDRPNQSSIDDGGSLFSRDGSARTASGVNLRSVVERVTQGWQGAPKINSVATVEKLPDEVKQYAEKTDGPLSEIAAVWHKGEVYLVENHPELSTEIGVEKALYHEIWGHHGIRLVKADDMRPYLLRLAEDMGGVTGLLKYAKDNNIDLSAYDKSLKESNASRVERLTVLTDELVSHMAENGPPNLKQRIKEYLGAIKQWLAAHGFPRLSKLSDLDLAYLMKQARAAVINGRSENFEGTAFQRKSGIDQTDTPEFKAWFGDSKGVDAEGKPLVVYHGTNADFDTFAPDTGWFTDSPAEAEVYGRADKGSTSIIPAYIKIQKPKYIDGRKSNNWRDDIADGLTDGSADGVILTVDGEIRWMVPASPAQIKSATGNSGAFDAGNPDIRFSRKEVAPDDVRSADKRTVPEPGIIEAAKRDLAEQIEGLRKMGKGRPKNPKTLLQRANSLRSAMFDSVVSRARSIEARNPKSNSLKTLFNQVVTAPGDSRLVGETMNEAVESKFAGFTNRVRNILSNEGFDRLTDAQNDQLRGAMLGTLENVPAAIQRSADKIRVLMDNVREDMIAAGIEVGEVDDVGYLTRLYDEPKILGDEAGFLEAAAKYYREDGFHGEVGKTAREVLYGEGTFARFLAAARRSDDAAVSAALDQIKELIKSYRNTSNVKGEAADIQKVIASIYAKVADSYAEVSASAWLHKIKTPNVSQVFNGIGPSGSPVTKERVLSGAADTIMADYMNTNMLDILDTYARVTTKKVAMAERFGPKGEKVQELLDSAAREGVSKQDLDETAELMESALGGYSPINPSLKSGMDFLSAWTYLTLLGRVVFSSAAEAMTFAIRTGDMRHAAAPLVQVYRAALKTQNGKDLNELALVIGVNGNKAMDEVMQNQIGGDYGMEPRWSKLVHRFMSATMLTTLTRAQRAYGVGASTGYLRWISGNIVNGKRTNEMGVYLNELGISDHAAFANWMNAQGTLPNPAELFDSNGRPTPRGQDYMVAVRRMTDQTIQNPNASHRPAWMNNPVGRLVGSVMGFSYASYENVIKREVNLNRSLRREAPRTGAAERRLALALGGAASLAVGQIVVSVVREMLFNAARFEDKDDEEIAKEMVLLGLSRTFGLGSGDPIIQYMTGLKYRRTASETASGAAIGSMMELIDSTAGLVTESNSPSNDTAEYRAMEQVYSKIITPTANMALSRIPYLSAVAIPMVSDKRLRQSFAGLFFEEPEKETEADREYSAATKGMEELRDTVRDRLALKPIDQLDDELESLKKEYYPLLEGVTLAKYKKNNPLGKDGKQWKAGQPIRDSEGKPKITLENSEGGSLLGELNGYPRTGSGGKEYEVSGTADRIKAIGKAIKLIEGEQTITRDMALKITEKMQLSLPTAQKIYRDKHDGGAGGKPIDKKARKQIVEELMFLRREEKRAAVTLEKMAEKKTPIPMGHAKSLVDAALMKEYPEL